MKKMLVLAALIFLAMVMFAGTVLADSSAEVNDVSANASAAASASNTQMQDQSQVVNAAGGSVNNLRGHIQPLTGPSGDFVGASAAPNSDDWQEFKCQPLLRVFTSEQLRSAAKGSIIQSSLRQEKVKADGENVVRLDRIPQDAVLRGEFVVEGKDGEGLLAPLSKAILTAAETTNAHRVFVWVRLKRGAKNSGLSIGSGAGGAISSPNTSKAIGLGGLLGWTWADVTEACIVKVWAFGDGPIDPPNRLCPCGGCAPASAKPAEVKPTTPAKEPPPAPKAEVVPTPAKKCPPTPVEREIAERHGLRWPCLTLSHNNGQIHSLTGFGWIDHFRCSDNRRDILAAVEQFEAAEKNLLGLDAKKYHRKEAQVLLSKVYTAWVACVFELDGRKAAIEFAKKHGLAVIPPGIAR